MKPPVVLVHGFLATPALMTAMRWRLTHAGHRVYGAELGPLAVQDVRVLGAQLDATVDRVRLETDAEQVSIVGVSQGGIIAVWWAHHLDGWPRTARMVAVGAPFRGSWLAAVGVPFLGWCSQGIWQLLPDSRFLEDEVVRPLPAGARFTSISLDGDPVCPPDRCAYPGAENRVFQSRTGLLKHQWLTFSGAVGRAVVEAL
jgi:pimeloyl-ACP methyl ester carboxylesterase